MTAPNQQSKQYEGPPIFSIGFRPFFLAGSLIATLFPIVTSIAFSGLVSFKFAGGILVWHGHEMVYGYLAAIITGFTLTAVPNWTGRTPLRGRYLVGVFALWVTGRIAFFLSDTVDEFLLGIIDCFFLVVVNIYIWREVFAGKNWRNLPICFLILLYAVGNFIWHLETLNESNPLFGLHFGISIIAILLSLVGGRIIPSFTQNWLVKTGRGSIDATVTILDKIAIVILVTGLFSWLFFPITLAAGILLIVAGCLHFLRLIQWQGWKTVAEPLVLILHIGYLWLALSIVLLGLSVFFPGMVSGNIALHALTAGAMGVTTLAVMTRATLGHTGRILSADYPTCIIFLLVNLGAILRIAVTFLPLPYATGILVSSILWGSAFALFAFVYGPYLLASRIENSQ